MRGLTAAEKSQFDREIPAERLASGMARHMCARESTTFLQPGDRITDDATFPIVYSRPQVNA